MYARKSSESEERQALSIDSQIREMYKVAEREQLSVVEVLTEAHSAKSTGERPVFNKMVTGIKRGNFNAILTWSPDRLSRNAGDLGHLVDLMDNGQLAEIQTYGQAFRNSPNEKFLLMILCSQAKLENDNRGENVKRGLRAAAERGYRPCVATTGYLNSMRRDHPGEVFIDKQRAPIVRIMFEKAAEGWSFRRITVWLRSINFTTRNGTYLYLSTVQKMLTNPFYYGTFEYPSGSGNWYKGNHKPIITKDLFDRAQSQFDARRRGRHKEQKSFAFTGIMKCGLCGSGVSAQEKFKRLADGSIARYVYYGCNHSKGTACSNTYIREDFLIKQLINIIDLASPDQLEITDSFLEEAQKVSRFRDESIGIPPLPDNQDKEVKSYIKYLLSNGSQEEKQNVLRGLRNQLILRDKTVYLEGINDKPWTGRNIEKKCKICGSANLSDSGPYANWKFGDKPINKRLRIVYVSCLDCDHCWKQANEGPLRLMYEYEILPEGNGTWIKTSGSEFFVTKEFARIFSNPINKRINPIRIIGPINHLPDKNAYLVTMEYENNKEISYEIPSLRGCNNKSKTGIKVIANKDGLFRYND